VSHICSLHLLSHYTLLPPVHGCSGYWHCTSHVLSYIQATIMLCVIVACGVRLSNAAQCIQWPTGRWKRRLLCGSHTGCLQAESVLSWLAACCHWALESSSDLTVAQTYASNFCNIDLHTVTLIS